MKRRMSFVLSIFTALSILYAPATGSFASASQLQIHMIDVGQGDAILIDYNNYEILLDAGENNMGDTVVNYLKPYVNGNLDFVIATHPDSDHIGGLDVVLQNFKVDSIVDSGMSHTTKTYTDYFNEVNKQVQGGASYSEDSDRVVQIDSHFKLEIIETGDNNGSKNNNSVVAKLTYDNVSCLLTGDMEKEVEHTILERDLKADILKAGHHGSRSSSSPEFLAKVNPQVALISAAKNSKYGHPHAETINAYESMKIAYFGTAELGSVVVNTDGQNFTVDGKQFTGGGSGGSTTPTDPTNPTDPIDPTNPTDPTTPTDPTDPTTPTDPTDPTTPTDPTDPIPPVTNTGVVIKNIDSQAEVVTIQNESKQAQDLTGWYVHSVLGGQKFKFPSGFTLKAGETVQIVSGSTNEGDADYVLKWSKAYVWATQNDPGELYDASDKLISSFGK